MTRSPPCTRHDRAGIDDPMLRDVLADASTRAGRNLSGLLRALYNHDGQLLATWRDAAARDRFAASLTASWQARTGNGRILNLAPSDEGYDYQEDVVDSDAD